MTYHLFRIARAISRNFPLAIFFLYLGLFLCTFTLVFVFPPGALAMVFLGLGGLLFFTILAAVLRATEHLLARMLLRQGICPGCSRRVAPVEAAAASGACDECGAVFLPTGVEQEVGVPV